MQKKTQNELIEGMMKRPIPHKRIGIIHLEMVREARTLYGMKRFKTPSEVAECIRPLFSMADREMMVALSLDSKLEPLALEIVAVGGLDMCLIDVKNIFKHSILNNAAYIACFHNHPSGDPSPSAQDYHITKQISAAGDILKLPLVDHIIVGENTYFSFREHALLNGSKPDNAA